MKNKFLFSKRSSVRAVEDAACQQQSAPALVRNPARRLLGTRLVRLSGLALAGAAVMTLLAIGLFVLPHLSIEGLSGELQPDTAITLSIPHLGASISSVALTETTRDIDGRAVSERSVPVELVPNSEFGLEPSFVLRLERQDGNRLLDYDRIYHLEISLRTKAPAFPLPKDVPVTWDLQFSTLTTPQVRIPGGVVEMAYQKPLQLRWNSPIRDFSVETQPRVTTRTWIDSSNPDISYVELAGADPGALYQIQVTKALGTNGAAMLAPATITVETPASPKPITDSVQLEDGDRVVLRWDRSVNRVEYQITPEVQSSSRVDPSDPKLTYILLQDPEQQQEYQITITGGTGTTGAPIIAGPKFSVVTPPPLEVTKLSPKGSAYGIPLDSAISITFDEAIKDMAGAQAAISFEPALQGHFEWPDSNQVRFVPDGPLPDNTEITVHMAAGPKGVKAANGSYLQEDYEYSFLTQPDKLIEVDLTHQTITLYAGDKVVYTGLVAAGVAGAPTPTGLFMVNFKMASTRMRGVNPDGSRYDIPNVPWVMSFLGDYTLHGAPWRSRFGYPGSNGCVSMETGQAKILFDWSPVGTPVRIHQ